jgi:hypothetical protein
MRAELHPAQLIFKEGVLEATPSALSMIELQKSPGNWSYEEFFAAIVADALQVKKTMRGRPAFKQEQYAALRNFVDNIIKMHPEFGRRSKKGEAVQPHFKKIFDHIGRQMRARGPVTIPGLPFKFSRSNELATAYRRDVDAVAVEITSR